MAGETYRATIDNSDGTPVEEPKPEGEEPAAEETLLAGKYKSEEELMKGTSELLKQKGIGLEQFYKNIESGKDPFEKPDDDGTPANEDPPDPNNTDGSPSDDNTDDSPAPERTAVENLMEENGLSLETFEQEFIENNGELTEESMEKLKTIFPESMIDAYIQGNMAKAEQYQNTLADEVGGQEDFQKMLEWGANNLSEEEVKEFDDTIKAGNVDSAKRAVRALAYEYQKANPPAVPKKGSNLLNADRKGPVGPGGYESRDEHVKDVQDARYKTDPAFRKHVEERLKKTTTF